MSNEIIKINNIYLLLYHVDNTEKKSESKFHSFSSNTPTKQYIYNIYIITYVYYIFYDMST